jgi:hypothetical protein
MKHMTGKQAKLTVTIQVAGGVETFFFYDLAHYGEILATLHNLELKTLQEAN